MAGYGGFAGGITGGGSGVGRDAKDYATGNKPEAPSFLSSKWLWIVAGAVVLGFIFLRKRR